MSQQLRAPGPTVQMHIDEWQASGYMKNACTAAPDILISPAGSRCARSFSIRYLWHWCRRAWSAFADISSEGKIALLYASSHAVNLRALCGENTLVTGTCRPCGACTNMMYGAYAGLWWDALFDSDTNYRCLCGVNREFHWGKKKKTWFIVTTVNSLQVNTEIDFCTHVPSSLSFWHLLHVFLFANSECDIDWCVWYNFGLRYRFGSGTNCNRTWWCHICWSGKIAQACLTTGLELLFVRRCQSGNARCQG